MSGERKYGKKIMLLTNGYDISLMKQIVYGCFLLMFEK